MSTARAGPNCRARVRDRRARVRWRTLAAVVSLLGASCTRQAPLDSGSERTAMSDIAMVEPEDETSFTDLPGVGGFDDLDPSLQAAVLSRANRARCDCGCTGHSVNACLHQGEVCDVARSIAAGFVTDASVLALVIPEEDAAGTTNGIEGEAVPTIEGAEAAGESGATGSVGPPASEPGESAAPPAGESAPAAPAAAEAVPPAAADAGPPAPGDSGSPAASGTTGRKP